MINSWVAIQKKVVRTTFLSLRRASISIRITYETPKGSIEMHITTSTRMKNTYGTNRYQRWPLYGC